jgi:hypothetical protein
LAHAHSKAGGAPGMIAGYLGRSTAFDEAIVEFAESYANQNERDYDALVDAVHKGTIEAVTPATDNPPTPRRAKRRRKSKAAPRKTVPTG